MALRKHGEGSVLRGEDVQKTAAHETDADREARLEALREENEANDG